MSCRACRILAFEVIFRESGSYGDCTARSVVVDRVLSCLQQVMQGRFCELAHDVMVDVGI